MRLRIGNPLPERGADEPNDEVLGWEREGQSFPYLTKWLDALSRAATALGQPEYHRHAVELAESVFSNFLQHAPSGETPGPGLKDERRPIAPADPRHQPA
jgi:hypothetical protein